jgi:Domain of unknown function (DUF4160)
LPPNLSPFDLDICWNNHGLGLKIIHAHRPAQKRFRVFFWSNDHSPAHIHVFKAGGEAKFNLEPMVELVYTRRMKVADISQAQRLVKQHHAFLLKAFQENEDRK